MKFNRSDIQKGLDGGLKRANVYLDKQLPPENIRNIETKVKNVFSAHPSQLSDRFVILFAELAGIAEMSRFYYREIALNEKDLSSFLHHAVSFFNSFTHK